ncbi:outer membrane beta-barrel protein [Maridesulfovibrio salexigens]|uniref:Outer membrane protein beta-barrel domain-containing protein n=1 Tax=Maridesulfovibrio salexigens (strain ATCC 14822 / DSM 2638 / NCIMB 8403 / VKM B-1763) TaxID=526222 RepID=C6BUD7_MARSD|nr:outer membrane beta-barrel protein [Maridesulfovibrio salexigens]ACS79946.1 hypothetical protein Desal_1885 [Maridesulfovibrio salexigens DSM 2638]
MLRLLTILIAILLLPALSFAWPGKIVAVEGATSFIVLKDGQTPVKVNIPGVKAIPGLDAAKARLESSNLVLMRDVDVREISKDDEGNIIGDITVDGKSISKELLDEGIVQSTATPAPSVSTKTDEQPKEVAQPITAEQAPSAQTKTAPTSEASAAKITDDLMPENSPQSPPEAVQTPIRKTMPQAPQPQPKQQVRYVQVYQPQQQLGLWPGRPAPTAAPQPAQQVYYVQKPGLQQNQAAVPVIKTQEQPQQMQSPGDAAKRDYELAVRVQKKSRRTKNKGFFVPKKSSETFLGVGGGAQAALSSKSDTPYSSFGGLGGISARHFFPSGFGIGGDFLMGSSSGSSGTYGTTYYDNGTINSNGTAYDYKNKNFTTYTFMGSLLYRFYADRNFTPYIAAHGGYSFFDYPGTIFKISDGAPVAGGGAGFLYEFDSGFTIGLDSRYLKTFGGKKDDPNGFFDTMFNIGYTFD